jgi:hypothetical protein
LAAAGIGFWGWLQRVVDKKFGQNRIEAHRSLTIRFRSPRPDECVGHRENNRNKNKERNSKLSAPIARIQKTFVRGRKTAFEKIMGEIERE